jgi:acetolactate synthase I/III small subunit
MNQPYSQPGWKGIAMTNQHVLSVLVLDHPGLLAKVAGLFSRRGFNIESLAVGHSEKDGFSRITIVVNGDDDLVDQVAKQLDKLIDVVDIHILPDGATVQRELLLAKVSCCPDNRAEILQIADIFRASIIDVSPASLTLEITGQASKLKAFIDMLTPYGILRIVRTGMVAVERN